MVEGVVKGMCALFSSASLLLALQTSHSSQYSNGTMEIHMYRPQEAGHRRQGIGGSVEHSIKIRAMIIARL